MQKVAYSSSKLPPYFRVFILGLSTITATLAMSLPLILNFTVLTMTATNSSEKPLMDIASVQILGTVDWNLNEKSMALSSFAWSATVIVLPLSFAMQLCGAQLVFTVSALIGATATALLPLVALNAPFAALLICRFVQGLGYCSALPMIGAMTARWASIHENGRFMALASCCFTLAPLIAMPLAGTAGTNWPLAFYILASLSGGFTLLWAFIYRNLPHDHPLISVEELMIIDPAGRPQMQKLGFRSVPWKQILCDLGVWTIIVTTFGNMMGMQLIIIYLPTYLQQVLKLDPDGRSGLLCTLPYFAHMAVKIPAGFLSDKFSCCRRTSETFKVRVYNSISLLGMAVCFVALAFLKPVPVRNTQQGTEVIIAMTLFTLASGVLGFNVGSFFKSATLIARKYSGVVMGLLQMTTCVVIIIEPFIVGSITSTTSNDEVLGIEWRSVFLMTAAMLFVTNSAFCAFGSGEPAAWSDYMPS